MANDWTGNKKSIFVCHGVSKAYAWFVWEKGFTGKPVIEWI
jgi:hypothetical protein